MHQVVSGAWNQDKEIKVGDPSIYCHQAKRVSCIPLCYKDVCALQRTECENSQHVASLG